jgi:uncharacterized protein (DUF305 family)
VSRTSWAAISAVVLALLFAGTATVIAAGRDGGAGTASTPSATSPDAGFARDMAVHHQQAVEMSFIVRDSTDDEEVRRLAYDIANTQANQRGMLMGWLDLWGLPKTEADQAPMAWMPMDEQMGPGHAMYQAHDGALMPGMATNAELDQLRKARGKQAEVLYLQLMTDHHKGGVMMAGACARQCAPGTERELAKGMVVSQESEIAQMADLLKERGAKPRVA